MAGGCKRKARSPGCPAISSCSRNKGTAGLRGSHKKGRHTTTPNSTSSRGIKRASLSRTIIPIATSHHASLTLLRLISNQPIPLRNNIPTMAGGRKRKAMTPGHLATSSCSSNKCTASCGESRTEPLILWYRSWHPQILSLSMRP